MGFAFLHDDSVVYAFEALVDAMPDDVGEQLDSFLLYFKRTWIDGKRTARKIGNAKFPPRTWNALRRTQAHMKRTNNYAEGFHSGFTQLIGCTNPTIWAFLLALKLQQSITDRKMTAEIFSDAHA